MSSAVALARHMQATLTVCAVEISRSGRLRCAVVAAHRRGKDGAGSPGAEPKARRGADAKCGRRGKGASVDLRERQINVEEPFVVEVLPEASRAYDRVSADFSRPIVEAVLFGSGRPVILYPGAFQRKDRPCRHRLGRQPRGGAGIP
ncbi:hypothetical protein RJJ37_25365 [Rhizobium redzepovicii]|uniref:Uncharacterized protein n=1 Tax=Rhizobium redzepovicii TaxID=2867518 RepID=A0AAW8P8R7_9HYPH|nr:hypothetical protein [Rhizobium redzepovicii]MDR9762910.1 hypothetical protein [Rhizobium redzepovicii]MDR9780886.1 hypothetical protein [Rhizobium redzepovicii]